MNDQVPDVPTMTTEPLAPVAWSNFFPAASAPVTRAPDSNGPLALPEWTFKVSVTFAACTRTDDAKAAISASTQERLCLLDRPEENGSATANKCADEWSLDCVFISSSSELLTDYKIVVETDCAPIWWACTLR